MRRFTSSILPVVAVVAVLACADRASAQQLPTGVTAAMIDQGKGVFNGAGNCMSCHGENGAGTALAPQLNDAKWLHIDGSFDALVGLITKGVPTPKEAMIPMAPKGGSSITDAQVKAVAAYVWKLANP